MEESMSQWMRPLRIAIADDERDTRDFFQELLPRWGHEVVAVAETGRQLAELCRATHPDLIITDIKMPDMDGIEATTFLNQDFQAPVILVSAHHDGELIMRAVTNHIMAYLVKPVKPADLETAIALAMERFDEFQKLSQEAANLRQALEDRKVIERAKGIIMKRTRLDEPEAFRRLQKLACDRNMKIVDYARIILAAEEAFQISAPGATPPKIPEPRPAEGIARARGATDPPPHRHG
jgi:response regulator NasT